MLYNLLRRVQNNILETAIRGYLQPLSVTLAKRRAQFAGHAFRAKGKIISDILLLKGSTGRKLTFPDTISRDIGIKVENLSAALANRTVWCKNVCGISATAIR